VGSVAEQELLVYEVIGGVSL